jgi:mannose/cellobiose epimerase-like protein (N-acyl-D-glucosamine 2-epimerase family)
MGCSALTSRADAARRWLFESAAPLWSGAGWHADGMFAERLSLSGDADRAVRRTRVQSRQIYAFCELGRLGWRGNWRTPVESALQVLLDRGRRPDGLCIHSFSADGEPADTRADLYDQAFFLFCLGHAARALARPELLDVAAEVLGGLESWRHPAGGFSEGEIALPPRRQNPHMHVLEAASVLWDVSGLEPWRVLVEAILALCLHRFIDPATGALTEDFGDGWTWRPDIGPPVVEPGHCFEWAWLIEGLAARGLTDGAAAERLGCFARKFGIDRSRGVAINEVGLDGLVRDPTARLWPQTERLKAALARWRRTGGPGELAEAAAAFDGLRLYLKTATPGVWRDRLLADGTWAEEASPASSFYHIVCGLSELIQTAEAHDA